MDLCAAYSTAAEKENLTDRQMEIAAQAYSFLRAFARLELLPSG